MKEDERHQLALEILRLYTESDFSTQEIAERLGISTALVYRCVHNASVKVGYAKLRDWSAILRNARASGIYFHGLDKIIAQVDAMVDGAAFNTLSAEGEKMHNADADEALVAAADGIVEFKKEFKECIDALDRCTRSRTLIISCSCLTDVSAPDNSRTIVTSF